MPRAFHLSVVLAAAVLAAPAAAQLSGSRPEESFRKPDSLFDGSAHERRAQISLMGLVAFGFGFGGSARYSLPLLKDGFIPELNDSIEADLGGDIIFPGFGAAATLLGILAEPRWTFHFAPELDLYVKLGAGYYIPIAGSLLNPFQVLVSAGGSYRLGNLWLRGELGILGAKVGIGLDF